MIAADCATADALATAFMVMGVEEALAYCERNSIDALFIYSDNTNNLQVKETTSFSKYK